MNGSLKKYSHMLFFIICVCAALCLTLFACNDGGSSHTLTFVADGETIGTVTGEAGDAVTLPQAPQKDGHDFIGWFDDPSFGDGAEQAGTVMPDRDVTYYAKYVARVNYSVKYYLQKLSEDKSSAIDEYELYATVEEQGRLGSEISAPANYEGLPDGFVRSSHEGEVLSVTLGEDESKNVLAVYFDRVLYTVSFDSGGGNGEMETLTYPSGAIVSPNFENSFEMAGHRFAGFAGSYDNGDPVPTTAFELHGNVTFVAQWHKGYANAADDKDVVYYDGNTYYRVVDGVRENAETKATFDDIGVDEFVFDEGEETEKYCRRLYGSDTFAVRSEEVGSYLLYNYIYRQFNGSCVLSLDGFGIAAYSNMLAGGGTQSYPGTYYYDDTYKDWTFLFKDEPESGFYFDLQEDLPQDLEGAQLAGSFVMHGEESGEFVQYSMWDSMLLDGEMLQLFGNGEARIVAYDPDTDDFTLILSQGKYYGTENYEDALGEWFYEPTQGEGFRFVLNQISGGEQAMYIYIVYDQTLDVELSEESGGGKLTIGGYNAALYSPTGGDDAMSGAIEVLGANVLRFVPYENGVAREPITFGVKWTDKTFSVNTTGLVVEENGVLTGYVGTSTVVAIPDDVTEIAANALKYGKTGVSLTHVTIPASVTKIGSCAFENNYTLRSVVFESEQPIEIDWSNENDPFRWPMSGTFKIFVPNEALDAYRAAWNGCKYKITSVFEENNKPEFEIDENGVLISYNNKDEDPHDLAIVLPSEVKSVGANVFKNLDFIASVDLNNATEIGASAFEGCSGLTGVKADNLEEIGEAAFALCTSLTSINLPKIKTISAQAFAACEALEKVSLGASIDRIGDSAFSECATLEYSTLFVLELADGADVPIIGENVFYGCFGFRVSVATTDDALALYDGAGLGWTKYAGRASVRANENGAIAGDWIDLSTLLPVTVGGRLETTLNAYIYSLSGETLMLYYYSYSQLSGSVDRATIKGSYKGGKISFEHEGASYVIVKREGTQSYKSNANETLVIDLDSYKVEEIPDSEGFASTIHITVSATFEGQTGTIVVNGNSSVFTGLTLASVMIEGKEFKDIKSDMTLKLTSAGSFTYTTTLNDVRGPYTAADGSYINLVYHGSGRFLSVSLCFTGCIKQFVNNKGELIVVETLDTWSVTDIPADGTYTFVYNYLNDRYFVTVTLDEATKTFTYSAEKAASRVVLSSGGAEKVIVLLDKDGETILSLSLLVPDVEGNTESLYVRKFTLGADGSYTVEAEQRQMVYDEATGGYVSTLGPLSGVYTLTLDFAKGACTVVQTGALPPAED